MTELKGAKEQLEKLKVSYDKSKITVEEKTREVKALENKVKALEKNLLLEKTLVEIRSTLWANIGQSIPRMRVPPRIARKGHLPRPIGHATDGVL